MLVGHEKTLALLSKIAASGNIPHALLFTGQGVSAKKEIAIHFAKYMFHGTSSGSQEFSAFCEANCVCNSCQQISRRIHPDFYFTEESVMQIREVRGLKDALSLTPFIGPRKIAIIDQAEMLRAEAANALLKLLEEPRGNALLILIASSRADLLRTVSSRAVEIRFVPRSMTLSKRYDADTTLRALRAIEEFAAKGLDQRFAQARRYNLTSRADLITTLDIWLLSLRETLIRKFDNQTCTVLKQIIKAKQLLMATNTNPQLILEDLVLRV